MPDKPDLLSDDDMQRFIREGYISVQADLPESLHQKIYDDATVLYDTEGNPGNDLLARIPALYDILGHPAVDGALQSLLGSDYFVHPHRHGHFNPPGNQGQNHHKDSYEADENVRHHHCRWVMGFYYPQDVDATRGPSAIIPGTQYFCDEKVAFKQTERPLHGSAGAFTLIHYDLWHRAMANTGPLPRFMLKFLFCRMSEPATPSWDSEGGSWQTMDHKTPDRVWAHQWDWYNGRSSCSDLGEQSMDTLLHSYHHGDEFERMESVYSLGTQGVKGVSVLMDLLKNDARKTSETNLEKDHTNPCQFDVAYGLVVAGKDAIPPLIDALTDAHWAVRASAADILGDMGTIAIDTTPDLIRTLTDPSAWVRRNSAEALGIFGEAARAAVPALTNALFDQNAQVRLNAVSALQRIDLQDPKSADCLRKTLKDEEYFVRAHAQIALDRMQATA